ncbi:MAG: hypothetical protein JW993_18650 [Sedimentisphaerales bacterium]|nr:hypothetical protein [Sedimentisphaerales bacterium]
MERACLIVAAALVVTVPLCAAEFPINTRLSGAQCNPTVAATGGGDFVVAWSSYYSSSGRSNEIMARRFDRTGAPLDGDEFQVNVTREGNQTEPAVAIDARGGLAVVWEDPGRAGVDIVARIFDANGDPLTDELTINAAIPGERRFPRVAAGLDGSFVAVWEDRDTGDAGLASVWGRSFDVLGARQATEFLVAADFWDCRYPDVATDAAGNFVVTWLQDRTSKSVCGRLFDANGLALSDAFDVSEVEFSSVTRPAVAMNERGHFVVTWDGDPNLASLDDIHARCFEPNGAPQSSQFLVNTLRAGAQQWPRVAVDDANDVVFVWQSDGNDPGVPTSIHARRFDVQGRPLGEEVRLAPSGWDTQRYPDVALAADGAFVAAWESAEPDSSDYDILATTVPAPFRPDLDGDARVDLHDIQVLGQSWRLAVDGAAADLNQDGLTDARDLEILCSHWLR